MFGLTPYVTKRNEVENYNPFKDLDNFVKAFYGEDGMLAGMKTDIKDKGDHFELEADLPGFKKEDIRIDMDENTMTISAERHSEYEEKDKKGSFVRCERSYGSYSRSFDVSGIDTNRVEAEYTDGVLKLNLPKKQPSTPPARRLEIR